MLHNTNGNYWCTILWLTIFKGFTQLIVIIKYWLPSLCYTTYPYSLLYLLIPYPYISPKPSSPYWQQLICSLYFWVSFSFLHSLICQIYQCCSYPLRDIQELGNKLGFSNMIAYCKNWLLRYQKAKEKKWDIKEVFADPTAIKK